MSDHWWQDAACIGMDLAMFFPGPGRQSGPVNPARKAKQVCADCPVRSDCLAEAVEIESANDAARIGIRGGLSADERRRLVRAA